MNGKNKNLRFLFLPLLFKFLKKIWIEHVTKNINEMKEDNIKMKNSQDIINTKVVEYINKFDNSSDKGNLSEAKLKFVL